MNTNFTIKQKLPGVRLTKVEILQDCYLLIAVKLGESQWQIWLQNTLINVDIAQSYV